MKKCLSLLFSILVLQHMHAQKDTVFKRKEYEINRAVKSPKIDGVIDESTWENVNKINSFVQNYPEIGGKASLATDVMLAYDNTAIYIAAKLHDPSPDSIRKQLGNRDDNVNADVFRVVFDTYNTQQDAFDFSVTASGVQIDSKFSDGSYNAVWESAVKINENGWSVEIKIPYSAIRFPNVENQIWGMQITRSITRYNEFDQWSFTPRGVPNPLAYWGILKGLNGVKEPVRLSLTPYISAYTSHYPANIKGESNFTTQFVGGLDLKYGINESFTVDATLLPDFTQVQSDNLVKNLSAFEVQYDEQRPFFQEGTELFQKGNLFYSRRIGKRPSEYFSAYNKTEEGETIVSNPNQSKLINATKVSGRTENGLGLGILNAVLDNTYAIAKDSAGNQRKILTEPFSNYNIIVFDQQLKNSSSAYLINTNVNRQAGYNNSNVTGAGISLFNKKNTYGVFGDIAFSNVFSKVDTIPNQYTDLFGYKYNMNVGKTSGMFQFSLIRDAASPTYNNNDMGITRETNFINDGIELRFNRFNPFGRFLNAGASVSYFYFSNFTTHRKNGEEVSFNLNGTLKSFHSIYLGGNARIAKEIDYYESRTPGRLLIRPRGITFWGGFDTDRRKRFTLGVNIYGGSTGLVSPTIGYNPYFGFTLRPNMRFTDKFSVDLSINYSKDNGDRGFVNRDEYNNIIFGLRYITNLTTSISARYLFKNNLSLSLNARHYWTRGDYKSFYNLSEEGNLIDNISYDQNHDFNFNTFNIDMVFQWQFAPGSFVNLVWKNSIYNEGNVVINDYSTNMKNTFETKQLNIVSLKILYFFDYLYLVKKKSKKDE